MKNLFFMNLKTWILFERRGFLRDLRKIMIDTSDEENSFDKTMFFGTNHLRTKHLNY